MVPEVTTIEPIAAATHSAAIEPMKVVAEAQAAAPMAAPAGANQTASARVGGTRCKPFYLRSTAGTFSLIVIQPGTVEHGIV